MQLEEHQPTQDDHNEPSQDPIDEGYEGSSHQHFDLLLGSSHGLVEYLVFLQEMAGAKHR